MCVFGQACSAVDDYVADIVLYNFDYQLFIKVAYRLIGLLGAIFYL